MKRQRAISILDGSRFRRNVENLPNDASASLGVSFAGNCLVEDRCRYVIVHDHGGDGNQVIAPNAIQHRIPTVLATQGEDGVHFGLTRGAHGRDLRGGADGVVVDAMVFVHHDVAKVVLHCSIPITVVQCDKGRFPKIMWQNLYALQNRIETETVGAKVRVCRCEYLCFAAVETHLLRPTWTQKWIPRWIRHEQNRGKILPATETEWHNVHGQKKRGAPFM